MTPVVALVGRPNVGKSTLFNRLTRTRDALVADFPGLTRDRKYGQAKLGELEFIVVDTGGIDGTEEGIELKMAEQSLLAIEEADVVLFMVDARAGLTAFPAFGWARARRVARSPASLGRVPAVGRGLCASDLIECKVRVINDRILETGSFSIQCKECPCYPVCIRTISTSPGY
mgnify:CR=1 FL=1